MLKILFFQTGNCGEDLHVISDWTEHTFYANSVSKSALLAIYSSKFINGVVLLPVLLNIVTNILDTLSNMARAL